MEREMLLADEAMSALIDYMKRETVFEGTATELCERLGLKIGANNLSSKLAKYENSLRHFGVEYTKEKRKNQKILTVKYIEKTPRYDETMISQHGVNIEKSA